MTSSAAAQLLGLDPSATPDEVEARYGELRSRLEDRIARAPTPGLKEKYRAALSELTTAFETLLLAADGANLPVLQRHGTATAAAAPQPAVAPPAPRPASPAPARSRAARLGLAAVALVVLAALAWGLWHGRAVWAEKVERERLEQEQLAAAERQQRERETALIELRAAAGPLRLRWEALEAESSAAERRLAELRSDMRAFRDQTAPLAAELQAALRAQQRYTEWLQPYVARHAAKGLLARHATYLDAGVVDDARDTGIELAALLDAAEIELREQRRIHLTLNGVLRLETEPAGLAFTLTDAYGREQQGQTPAELAQVPLGPARVRFRRTGWPEVERMVEVRREETIVAAAEFRAGGVRVESDPPGLPWRLEDAGGIVHEGLTPAELPALPAGPTHVLVRREGWGEFEQRFDLSSEGRRVEARFAPPRLRLTTVPSGASVEAGGRLIGVTPLEARDLPPGTHEFRLSLAEHYDDRLSLTLKGGESLQREVALRPKPKPKAAPGRYWQVPDLALHFLPLAGTAAVVSATKIPASAYAVFAAETGRPAKAVRMATFYELTWKSHEKWAAWYADGATPDSPERPITIVTWEDANAFCEWLTRRERAAGRLTSNQRFRLLSSYEWELMRQGIPEKPTTPLPQIWPVGGRPPAPSGFYDVDTYLSEWCSDGPRPGYYHLRGGFEGRFSYRPAPEMSASSAADQANLLWSFRCVLEQNDATVPQAGVLGISINPDLTVGEVTAGLPAERAGIRPGDLLLSVDGWSLQAGDRWLTWKMAGPADSTAVVELRRGAEVIALSLRRAPKA